MSKFVTTLALAAVAAVTAPAPLKGAETTTTRTAKSASGTTSSASAAAEKEAALKAAGNVTCPVSGHAAGSMQAGSHIVYKGYKIDLCCDSCKTRFMSDPDAYLQKALKEKKQ